MIYRQKTLTLQLRVRLIVQFFEFRYETEVLIDYGR